MTKVNFTESLYMKRPSLLVDFNSHIFRLIAYTYTPLEFFETVYIKGLQDWATSRENLSSEVCEQQKRRPAFASAQSYQRVCYSLFGKYHIWSCYKRNFNFLASFCSWGDWFEIRFVWNPEDRFSRDKTRAIIALKCCILVSDDRFV